MGLQESRLSEARGVWNVDVEENAAHKIDRQDY